MVIRGPMLQGVTYKVGSTVISGLMLQVFLDKLDLWSLVVLCYMCVSYKVGSMVISGPMLHVCYIQSLIYGN